MTALGTTSGNALLASLKPQDQALLEVHLEPVELEFRQRLEPANRRIKNIYFIEQGLGSVVAIGKGERRQVEIGIVGREGMTGIAVVLGVGVSPHDTFMQVEGRGKRIGADELREALRTSSSLASSLMRFAHVFSVQTAHSALANAQGKIEERLARWLLMAQDRLLADDLHLTHEFLSLMLGVRRAGVTTALHQ